MWRFSYSITVWVGYVFFVFIPLVLFGYIAVPIALMCDAYYSVVDREKRAKGEHDIVWHFTWPFMSVYDNFEDGIANRTYFHHKNFWLQVIHWTCIRNPVNGLRTAPYLSCKVDPKKIEFVGTYGSSCELGLERVNESIKKYRNKTEPHWYFGWHGFYTCLFWQHKWNGGLKRLWIGWKIVPNDIYGVDHSRARGAKFSQQWRRM